MKKLFIAEKPSQMKSLKESFEPKSKKYIGYFEGDNYIFTNAFGHLLEINKSESKWSLEKLPIILNKEIIGNYISKKETEEQLKIIYKLLARKGIEEIICSTDPDAEGEAIYREIIESFEFRNNCKIKIDQTRLIIKDTTKTGLKEQYKVRRPISEYEGLRQRAYARAISDYTIGINLTQCLTLKSGILFTVGRVQTPTLKLIVDRYYENKSHKKIIEYGFEIKTTNNNIMLSNKEHKFISLEAVDSFILNNKLNFELNIKKNMKKLKRKPPKLYDLATVQKWANNKLSLKAEETLKVLQSLYEKGYITYPRTDCKLITEETANRLNAYFGSKEIKGIKLNTHISKQCVGEVTAHEGLTLTEKAPKENELNEVESKIYNQIKNIFISNYLNCIEVEETEYFTYITDVKEYKYSMKNYEILESGYLDFYDDQPFSNIFEVDEEILFNGTKTKKIESKPKALYTEASLITKMQNIHNDTDFEVEEEIKELSKEIEGIGTPATRGSIIKGLFDREYVENKGKSIIPTKKGEELIKILKELKSPLINLNYTAKLEKKLQEVESKRNLEGFLDGINNFTKENLESILNGKIQKTKENQEHLGQCPKCKDNIIKIVTKTKKNMFICKNKGCDFTFPVYLNLCEKDVKKLLEGNKSSVKKKKSKEGKEYKVRYFLDNFEIKQEFVNKY